MFSDKIEEFLNSSNTIRREIRRKLHNIRDVDEKFNSIYK